MNNEESKQYRDELNTMVGGIFIDILKNEGLLHDRDLRNIKIRKEFKYLIENGTPPGKAIQILSEKTYFTAFGQPYRIAQRSIEKIIYPNKKK